MSDYDPNAFPVEWVNVVAEGDPDVTVAPNQTPVADESGDA